ncbi:ComF family protein [Desulfosporosinus youngiae]|uniref:Putative amidophosphoribosyltransferase n=1 Tax=Desulfosporosinus youngiae DSM 17734 TaxID=768710 RepID=H5Y0I8_9FIRM|nr:ComF family protein [Desulfosporosinus youngiae]EHQ92244.1 putative amidophosphoribosyltransferase [Desulfosporosinus youngiae DSM 17734]
MKRFWREALKITGALWYENEEVCVFCNEEQGPICSICSLKYLLPELRRCQGCGKLIESENLNCLDCAAGRGPKQLDRVTAWGHYSGGLKEFIQTVKFKAHPRLIKTISRPFSDWAIGQLPPVDGIVAVPMHMSRLAERGYNQAEVIASGLHWELGLPVLSGVERLEARSPQALLSRQERLNNLKGVFAVRQPEHFLGKSVWLIDDVTTTGATLEAVAEALRESGVQEIYGLCLAAGIEKRLVPFGY